MSISASGLAIWESGDDYCCLYKACVRVPSNGCVSAMPEDVATLLVIGVELLNENHADSTDIFLRAYQSTLQFMYKKEIGISPKYNRCN